MTTASITPALTIDDIRAGLELRTTTATAIAEEHYARIEMDDVPAGKGINSFLALSRDRAFAQAAKIDALAAAGDPLPVLAGVPVGIKDVLAMQGSPATAGSKILAGYMPPYDATTVRKLEAAGAVLLGKLNCDEFAMGSSNENSAYGPVRNPRALDRVPGGSSGGSAAAVAAGFAVATLGTDTGGSIRQPAAFCGVVGLLPTYGRVSRYGLIAFASSLDRVGPVTNSVKDAATVLGVLAGQDPFDATSSDRPADDYVGSLTKPVAGLRVGVPAEYFGEGLDPEIRAAVEKPSPNSSPPGARSSPSISRIRSTPSPPTTSSPPPRPPQTSPASTASASATVPKTPPTCQPCTRRPATKPSGPRLSAASSSARTSCLPATTTPTTRRRSRFAPSSPATSLKPLPRWMSSSAP